MSMIELVKELRERTGAGMMECKRALEEAEGEIEVAIENMRKAGKAKAAKKSGRIASEGTVSVRISSDNKQAFIVEVNCETDFVARDGNFVDFANSVAARGLSQKVRDVESLAALDYAQGSGVSIEETRQNLITKIGENINIRRCAFQSTAGNFASYVHGGRIGVLVELQGGDEELGKEIAMHIAASNPQVVKPEQVPQELLDKEKEIFMAQARESGKPEEIIEKMVQGRLKKFLEEVSLLGQPFVKDPQQSVAGLLKAKKADVVNFIRYEVGEGVEKKVVDFAEEVMAQVKG